MNIYQFGRNWNSKKKEKFIKFISLIKTKNCKNSKLNIHINKQFNSRSFFSSIFMNVKNFFL